MSGAGWLWVRQLGDEPHVSDCSRLRLVHMVIIKERESMQNPRPKLTAGTCPPPYSISQSRSQACPDSAREETDSTPDERSSNSRAQLGRVCGRFNHQ